MNMQGTGDSKASTRGRDERIKAHLDLVKSIAGTSEPGHWEGASSSTTSSRRRNSHRRSLGSKPGEPFSVAPWAKRDLDGTTSTCSREEARNARWIP